MAPALQAAEIVWVGPLNGGFWDAAANWSPVPPFAGDAVALGLANVTYRTGALEVASYVGNGLLSIKGGMLSTLTASSIGGIALSGGGTLGGSGLVLVTGEALSTWGNGALSGAGGTTFLGDINFVGGENQNHFAASRSLVFAGTSTWKGDAWGTGFYLSAGATITNNGTWADQTTGTLQAIHNNGGDASKFINSGVYNKTGTGTTTIGVQFDNTQGGIGSGQLIIHAGRLALTAGGTSDGEFDIASGASVDFAGGTHTLFGITSGPGTGTLRTSAGSVFVNDANTFVGTLAVAGGTLTVNGTFKAGGFAMNGGSLTGPGSISIDGSLPSTWGAGTMAGTGTTTFAGPLTFVGGENQNHRISVRTLVLNGTSTWAADAWGTGFYLDSGATIINNGHWQDQTIGTVQAIRANGGAASKFVNKGLYDKTGTGLMTIGVTFDSVKSEPGSGAVKVAAGTLALSGGGTSNGQFDVSAGGAVAFSAGRYVLNDVSSGTGTGTLLTSGATVDANGSDAFAGRLGFSSGQMNVNGAFTAGGLQMTGGTLAGSGVVTFNGTLGSTWGRGTMAGTGTTVFNGPVTFVGGENQNHFISARAVVFNGTSTWTPDAWGTGFYLDSGATITNNGTWLDQTAGSLPAMRANGGSTPIFSNMGTYIKTVAGSTTDLSTIIYVNRGTTDVQAGTLRLPATFVNEGTLMGNGAVSVKTLTNLGQVAPGESPGTLTIGGSFTQASSGALAIELQTNSVHDVLAVTGSATLGGTLNLICYGTCAITPGQSIKILDAAPNSLSGSFASVVLTGFNSIAFDVVYDRTHGDVLLNTLAVPEPSIPAMLLAGLASLGWLRRRHGFSARS